MRKHSLIIVCLLILLAVLLFNTFNRNKNSFIETFNADATTKEEVTDELLIALFIEDITNAVTNFYSEYYSGEITIYNYEVAILIKKRRKDHEKKLKTRVICLIACLTMLFGSTVCVSAEGKTYTYCKADGTYEVRQGAIPTIDSRGIPVFYESAQGLVMESKVTTPGGNYVYGDWEAYYTPEQLNLLYSMIDGAGVTPGMSQYDKAVAINNYICSVARYADDIDAACRIPFGDGLIGMQMGGQLICGTYADLYQTMCEAVGIECRYEIGHVPTAVELHGWNIVTIDGKNYYVDVTWNDSLGNNAYLMSETPVGRPLPCCL